MCLLFQYTPLEGTQDQTINVNFCIYKTLYLIAMEKRTTQTHVCSNKNDKQCKIVQCDSLECKFREWILVCNDLLICTRTVYVCKANDIDVFMTNLTHVHSSASWQSILPKPSYFTSVTLQTTKTKLWEAAAHLTFCCPLNTWFCI